MHVPACVDDLILKVDQLLMVDSPVSPCKSYGLLWYLQTIVQDETDGIEIDVRINVETSSPTSAPSAKEAGSTQGGVQGQATDLIWNDLFVRITVMSGCYLLVPYMCRRMMSDLMSYLV